MFRFTNLIIFRFTRDCNLNCKYCFMTHKSDFKGEMITHDMFKKIIDKIILSRLQEGRADIELDLVFHGGEVLMIGKERLYQSADYVTSQMQKNKCKYSLSIQSNGVLLDDEYAQILNKFDIHCGMSFDGLNSNDERDIKQETFEKKFELLDRNKIEYGFLVVAGKHNINNIEETRKYLEDKRLGYKINYAEDMINPGPDSNIEVEGVEFFEKVYKPELENFLITGKTLDHQMKLFLDRAIIDIFTVNTLRDKTGCGSLFCGSCLGMIGVNPDGSSHYCDRYNKEYDETYVMNVLDYDFLGLHQLRRAMHFNRERHRVVKEVGCDTCVARRVCDGGCTAFHFSKYGKNGIDTRIICGIFKNFYTYVLENIEGFAKIFSKTKESIVCYDIFINIKSRMFKRMNILGVSVNIIHEDTGYIIKFGELE